MRTKIVQSVLAAALLFVCKEKITDATRDVLVVRLRPDTCLPSPAPHAGHAGYLSLGGSGWLAARQFPAIRVLPR